MMGKGGVYLNIMGGCLDKPKVKKAKVLPATLKNNESSARLPPTKQSIQEEARKVEEVKPKYKKMTIHELLTTYRVESTLQLSSKMEGPKYLSNVVDGSSRVLRVVNLDEINEKRLEAYKKVLGFQTYQNEEGSIMILDEYCAGGDLYDIIQAAKDGDKTLAPQTVLSTFLQVCKIVAEFHRMKTWLGNLTPSSFRRVSAFSDELRLVDVNLHNQVGEHEKMGFAHKESLQADSEFLGYLLQLIVCEQPPIFIPHKIQYVEFESIPYSQLVQKLLKGNPLTQEEMASIRPESIVFDSKVLVGYRFRRDINKLLKMRKKRRAHNKSFYGQDTKGAIGEGRFQEDAVYRLQAERIFARIHTYIDQVKSSHEQSFINYAGNNDSIRRLKEVFLLTDKEKKMSELKDCLSTIK